MKTYRIEDMIGGWFVGDFSPSAFKTDFLEASFKIHPKNEKWDIHYHEYITEINFLVEGKMILQGKTLVAGDIFVLEPFEVTAPEFIEDCKIVCIKLPGIRNDKVVLKKV